MPARSWSSRIAVCLCVSLLIASVSRAASETPTPDQVTKWVTEGTLQKLVAGETFVQVTDLHIWGSQPEAQPAVLEDTFKQVAKLYPTAMFIVATGDNGREPQFSNLLGKSTVPVRFTPGNHDGEWGLRKQFPKRYPFVEKNGNLQFHYLDTRLPYAWIGFTSRKELSRLHRELAAEAGKIVFVFGHHDPVNFMINGAEVRDLLAFHRDRYRFIMMCVGHMHAPRLFPPDRGVIYNMCPSLRDSGAFRVFHVLPDCIVFYDRLTPYWVALRKKLGKPVATCNQKVIKDILLGDPVVIPLPPDKPAKPLATTDEGFRKMAEKIAWPSDNPDVKGTVLDVRFDETKGYLAHDASPARNHVILESLSEISPMYRKFKERKLPSPRVARDKGFAMAFGMDGAWAGVAYDSRTLNSPVETNCLTVAADVWLPEEPLGWPYGIMAKEPWSLEMDEEGTVTFTVKPTKGKSISVSAMRPLPKKTWVRVSGVYDGKQLRLLENGEPIATMNCPAGTRLRSSPGGLRIGYFVKSPWGNEHNLLAPPAWFLLDNLHISNSACPNGG